MDFIKFLPHAIIIAILAAILQFVAMIPGCGDYVIGWAIFQTWALYFLAGANPKNGAKAVACGIAGALASMLIVVLGGRLAPTLGNHMGFTIAVMVVAFLCIVMERVPPLSFIPAYFICSGIFFALPATNSMSFKLAQVTISLLAGFGFGYFTVLFRTKYGAALAAADSAKKAELEPELVGK